MILTNEGYENIKRHVAKVYKIADIKTFPLNLSELAARLGIQLEPYSSLSAAHRKQVMEYSSDGCAVFADGVWTVRFNDMIAPKERIVFTILHEIGHAVLNHTQQSELADSQSDFFAKYAVCPPPIIALMRLKSSNELREKLQVSYQFSLNIWKYYEKWLNRATGLLTDYELEICNQCGYFPENNTIMEVLFNSRTKAS